MKITKKFVLAILSTAACSLTAAGAVPELVFDPDCVLYYDFETLNESGKIVNLANPGTMDGTIVGKNGLSPTMVGDSPALRIRQTKTSVDYETSTKSLENYIVSDSSRQNGYVECMPTDIDWFSKTNFTIECWFKTENTTQTYTPLFRRWGGYNVQINIGVGGTQSWMGYNFSTNTENQIQGGNAVSAGVWHHVAMVVDQMGENKTMEFYLDGILKTGIPLPSNIASEKWEGVNIRDGKWFFAGAEGGNSFDGKIDSMRVTLRALKPDEFIQAGKIPAGRTLAHVKFDDGTVKACDLEGGTMLQGIMAVSKNEGGDLPAFASDVPGAIIRDGENGEILSGDNTHSLSFANSKVTWNGSDDTYYLRKTLAGEALKAFTVEFFFKPSGVQYTWARLVSGLSGDSFGDKYAYALTFSDNNGGGKCLSLRGDSNLYGYNNLNCTISVCDGKWHHVAIAVGPNADDESKSDVTFYLDYGSNNGGWTMTSTSTVAQVVHADNLNFVLGTGSEGNGYHGLIDELRISAGALDPSEFLRAEKKPVGLAISFR